MENNNFYEKIREKLDMARRMYEDNVSFDYNWKNMEGSGDEFFPEFSEQGEKDKFIESLNNIESFVLEGDISSAREVLSSSKKDLRNDFYKENMGAATVEEIRDILERTRGCINNYIHNNK